MGHRIPFPQDLRIESALDDSSPPFIYRLKGIVVHMGQGYAYGHYFAVIKKKNQRWFRYDDTTVECVDEKYMKALFGNPNEQKGPGDSWPTAYLLLYEADDD